MFTLIYHNFIDNGYIWIHANDWRMAREFQNLAEIAGHTVSRDYTINGDIWLTLDTHTHP